MPSNNKTLSLFALIVFLYLLLRSINLTLLPIFNDESTYIRYGLHQLKEPDHKLYSLLIGKEPLLPYLYASFGTNSGDLLAGARWVTILFGLLTLVGLFLFTNSVAGRRAALFASLFYCLAPYTLFFDRLALLDSPVSTVAVWSLYLTYMLLTKNKWLYGFVLGGIMGAGLWIKTSDMFYIVLPVISYCIYFFLKRDEGWRKAKILFTAFVIAVILYLPLYTNPFYATDMQLLKQYSYPLYSVFLFPFSVWWNNFIAIVEWLFFYLTPPLFLLALGSLIMFTKKKKFLLVQLWLYLPLVYEMLYDKLFTSRHVLLLTIPLLIFAGYGMSILWQKKRVFALILGACILTWTLYDAGVLLTAPQTYPTLFAGMAKSDANQYVQGWSSGYGVIEAANYLRQQAIGQQIVVLIRNDHGNPEDAMVAYLDYQPNIIIAPMNDPATDVPVVFQKVGTAAPIYFVSRGGYNAGLEKYFESEVKFNKPSGDKEFVGVAQLKPAGVQEGPPQDQERVNTLINPRGK